MPLSKQEIEELYSREAEGYDAGIAAVRRIFGSRYLEHLADAVDELGVEPGETVVDLACGTGLNFERILARNGESGRLIGVDLTAAMLEKAAERVRRHGWRNVDLVHADAADYEFPPGVMRILSTAGITLVAEYDEVIARAARSLSPGGRMVLYDFKIPENWPEWRIQVQMRIRARFGQTRDLEERKPWESIARHFPIHRTRELYSGLAFLSIGEIPRQRE
ncbi:MAG TPA: methyltransferase domain-containing protein [Gemmatimonadota bacterium]|nr:methyltransferase domain-containing protein [Gemmatimonadota bacterium]